MAPGDAHTVFHREADQWLIEYGGKMLRLSHCGGFPVLAHLVANPGQRFRASALLPLIEPERPRHLVTLDPNGRRARKNDYRRRLEALRTEVDRAKELNDVRAARAAEREMQEVTRELARVIGLAVDDTDDPESAVREAIAGAIAAIGKSNRGLARHLSRSVSTGPVFRYTPE